MKKLRYISVLVLALLMAIVILPQIALAQDTTDQCADISFEGLPAGTIVTNQIPGVTITTNDPVHHPAMIFDSAHPTGGDLDLGTPNVDFGGPGRGVGGKAGADGENSVALGNVLILTEDMDSGDPDDNAGGGTFIITFASPVTVEQMVLLDIDETVKGTVKLFDAANVQLYSSLVGPVVVGSGDNGVYAIQPGVAGVSKITVKLPGSGAIASIVACEEVVVTPTEETPTPITPTEATPTEITPTPPTPVPPSMCGIDFVIMLDQSSAVDTTKFEAERGFATQLINSLPIDADNVNMGLGYFASSGTVAVPVTSDPSLLLSELSSHVKGTGFSNIYDGITKAQAALVAARPSAPNVMLIISDGFQSTVLETTFGVPPASVAADAARAAGTTLYAVGVPSGAAGDQPPNTATLLAIASDPDSDFYFAITFENLDSEGFVETISEALCEQPENVPPFAGYDNYVTNQDTVLNVPAPGVLLNDLDPNGDDLFIEASDLVTTNGGTVSAISATGSFTYTPPAGFTGVDQFTYQLNDGELVSNVAIVRITVVGEETPTPTATTPVPSATTPAPSETTPAPSETTPAPTTPAPSTCQIIRFELWNADTDTIIMYLDNNSVVDVAAFGNAHVTIVAVVSDGHTGSVKLTLIGAENFSGVENIVPYALFGDNEHGDFGGDRLHTGNYTISAKAYTQDYLHGIKCAEASLNFKVTNSAHHPPHHTPVPTTPAPSATTPAPSATTPAPSATTPAPATCEITHFEMWNADSNTKVSDIGNGSVIDLATLGGAEVLFIAWTNPEPVGRVRLDMSGAINHSQTEFIVPYTSFGNDYYVNMEGRHLVVGSYTLTATAYLQAEGGNACDQETINFTVVDGSQGGGETPTEATPAPTDESTPEEATVPAETTETAEGE